MNFENDTRDRDLAPPLKVHFSPLGTAGPLRRATAATMLPLMLRVQTVTINFASRISHEAQGICSEPAWTRFAETALKFLHLQHVELLHTCDSTLASDDPGRYQEPAFLGITDKAFKPLIEAGKFVYRLEDSDGRIVSTATHTVDTKAWYKQKQKEKSEGGVEGGSLEEAATHPVEGSCKYPLLDFMLADTDTCMQRKQDRIRLARKIFKTWRVVFKLLVSTLSYL